MGTPESAAKVLQTLIGAKEEIIGVITQPDRPKGRHLKPTSPPVKELALKYDLPVYQPEKITRATLEPLKPDLVVVVAYGKLLPKEVLDLPKYGSLNIHASLLPRYRGAAPIQHALLDGEKETGVTIFQLDETLDTGDIIAQEKVKIEEKDTVPTLADKLFKLGAELLLKVIADLKAGQKLSKIKQDPSQATYAPSLKKEDGVINWQKGASEILNQIRALNPWPGAFTHFKGKLLKIWEAEIEPATLAKHRGPGYIVELIKGNGFVVETGKGHLMVKEVQLEAGKRMPADDFVRGHGLKIGDLLE